LAEYPERNSFPCMAASSGNPVQEGDDDESDDGECGGGDHVGSFGALRFASVRPCFV
jgi:hypothetical protein